MTRYKEFDSILFVCELNAIRSAIAEYYLKSFDIKSLHTITAHNFP